MVQTVNGTPLKSRPTTSTLPLWMRCTCPEISLKLRSFSPFLKRFVMITFKNSVRTCTGKSAAISSTRLQRLYCFSGKARSGNIPSAQPETIPTTLDIRITVCTKLVPRSSPVRPGSGRPNLSAYRSMRPCNVMPAESETIWPIPAAARVENPKMTPNVTSRVSPTVSMIMLSKKPKPTKGTAVLINKSRIRNIEGRGTGSLSGSCALPLSRDTAQ
mmetsp:Transcript_22725/g.43637  ORF Transcript_22725/g.43637 Transcript_22725/m.43637 type:complete len:216 (-) Transcript_22725:368-1015(-)